MGDIREFWLAVAIYLAGAFAVYLILNTLAVQNLHPLLRAIAVIVGGYVLGTLTIFLWAGIAEMYSKRRD
jgi:hypothetical protein